MECEAVAERRDDALLVEELRVRIDELTNRLAEVLARIESIQLQENPCILADYASKIGIYEARLLEAQIAARRAKRAVALARVRVNKGLPIDRGLIEETLDEELSQWRELLITTMNEHLSLIGWLRDRVPMSPADEKRLNQLHRQLVKRFHPDLCKGDWETAAFYFAAVQRAFEAGDLEALEAIALATEGFGDDAVQSDDPLELEAQIAVTEGMLAVHEGRLAKLESEHPYCLKERLSSRAWVSAQVRKLKAQIEQQEAVRRQYRDEFEALQKEADRGNRK